MRDRKEVEFGKGKTPSEAWSSWRGELTREVVSALGSKLRPGYPSPDDAGPVG